MSTQLDQQSLDAEAQGDEEYYEESINNGGRFIVFTAAPSWLVSLVVHLVLIVILGLWTFAPLADDDKVNVLEIGKNEDVEEIEEIEDTPPIVEPVVTEQVVPTPDTVVSEVAFETPVEVNEPVTLADDLDQVAISVELSEFGATTAPKNDLMATIGAVTGHGVEGRGMKARGSMVRQYGGNESSEAAVAAALRWIAEHQYPDGGWNFDHTRGVCQGRCAEPGTLTTARNGATAMALLPFLGSGMTHMEGQYKLPVKGGLNYLVTHIKPDHGAGSLYESGGSMYSHGLASITLCEAYAMTQDKALLVPAQASLNFIAYAQDPVGGGWRYAPRSPGDTSAVGWQIMALKSGHMGYLQVAPNTVAGAIKFLDTVQADSGAYYGYTSPGKGAATTAVGLLCRMYLGWKKDEPALQRGVAYLSKAGPSKTNMYFNYYATQVMKQYGGEEWDKWNVQMRDYLVAHQDKNGHAKGSWHFPGGHAGERGGRLYATSMATMILEVYYRHMPIYGNAATEEDFPL